MSHLDTWTENFFDTQGGHIRYFRTGGAKPSMLLLHGAMNNGLCWTRVARALEKDFDIVMPDVRGHGKSVSTRVDYSLSDVVEDIAELINHLKIAPVIVMGHSMGAQMATELGARHPDLVKKLVLEDPGYYFKNPTFFTLLSYNWLIRRNKRRNLVQIRKFCDKLHKGWHDDDKIPWVVAQKQFGENAGKFSKAFDPKRAWHEIFPKVLAPTLLLISENGLHTRSEAAQYITEFVDARYAYIEDAGHNIRRDNFEVFLKTVQLFLVKVSQ